MTPPERVVCVGSSAGGLEALTEVLRSLPVGLPIAYIVAPQHLSPTHDSLLAEMLGRETELAVRVATDGAVPRSRGDPGGPPERRRPRYVATRWRSPRPGEEAGSKPSVDAPLLRSLAASWGANAVAVVLSGTGR